MRSNLVIIAFTFQFWASDICHSFSQFHCNFKKIKNPNAQVLEVWWVKPLPVMPAFYWGSASSPNYSTAHSALCKWPGKAIEDSSSTWILAPIWETEVKFLVAACFGPGYCNHMGGEPVDGGSLILSFCLLSLPSPTLISSSNFTNTFFQKKKKCPHTSYCHVKPLLQLHLFSCPTIPLWNSSLLFLLLE